MFVLHALLINDPLRQFRDDAYNLSGLTGLGREETNCYRKESTFTLD
ncbi:MAG: hypothetical protein HOM14_06405 [Gammaproteobacteria bacterium]|nr:hypothetical protein [Gammaproteobacteria bacterium]MBT3723723.1 hypothetical protein [Gammaproteobacteria bacterium]MBT4450957.1 hypothetical protein [Gammaproteobacteria bacterium]MBT6550968.1 hypothetical protein [Gammaproteobacteria bacterium]MBT6701451.1 hypothetical protein [Gammaproteobacteria bacterium]